MPEDSFTLASFMIESKSGRRRMRIGNFLALTRSWGLPLSVLGNATGASFGGWDHLQRVYLNHSSTRPNEHELVAYADSADAFVQGTTADWLGAFRRVANGKPVVVGLESNCPEGRCVPVADAAAPTPSGVKGYVHVNGGFVMGEAWALQRVWRAIAHNEGNVSCCDHTKRGRLDPQLGLGRFALAHPDLVAFDHRQELAANLVNFDTEEWPTHYEAVSAAGGRTQIANKHTNARPCWMHVPGLYGKKRAKQVGVYQQVAAQIVPGAGGERARAQAAATSARGGRKLRRAKT